MATLASLMVSLGMDASGFRRGATRAESALSGIEGQAQETEAGVESSFAGMGESLKTLGKAAGAGAGAALAKGVFDNLNIEQANAKLAAQLGLGAQEAGKAGDLASKLFRRNFADDIGQANEAMRAVVQQMNTDVGAVNFEPLTRSALSLARTFDIEVAEGARAAGQLIKTGLAENGRQAFDILTAGFQSGANQADDLLDTVEEYSVQFKDLGLSGQEAMGLLSQGLDAGAQNSDKVADALKELNIRTQALDNEKALQALGLDAQQMAAAFAQGGPTARNALQKITNELGDVQDPAKRAQLAVELFGTQGEDMASALGALDLSTATNQIGNVEGAARRAGNTARDTAQNKITQLKNQFQGLIQDAARLPGPLGTGAAAIAGFGPAALGIIGPLFSMMAAQRAAGAAAMVSGAQQSLASRIIRLQWIKTAAIATANAIRMAASWFIALGPIGWAIAAIVGLVAVIALNWDKVKKWTGQAWNWVWSKIKWVWQQIRPWVMRQVARVLAIIGWFKKLPGRVGRWFGNMKDRAVSAAASLVSWVSGLPGRILSALGDLGSLLWDAGKNVIQGLIDGIKSMLGAVGNAASSVASTIRDFLPFSPAKEGPLSGSGSPNLAGATISDMLASGMLGNLQGVTGASSRLADAASVSGAAGAGMPRVPGAARAATREPATVRLVVDGADEDMKRMIRKMVRVDGRGDVQVAFGR